MLHKCSALPVTSGRSVWRILQYGIYHLLVFRLHQPRQARFHLASLNLATYTEELHPQEQAEDPYVRAHDPHKCEEDKCKPDQRSEGREN